MRFRLTEEQKVAATAADGRVYIEASPGSGKTTVAAERYGVTRYGRGGSGRGVVALSFARSARGELERRVRRRWGVDAMRWPHRVWTLDSLHCSLVLHLLRSGAVAWPGGHNELTVVDSWRGTRGGRPVGPGGFAYGLTVNGAKVMASRRRVAAGGSYFTNRADYLRQLADGVCTHEEVRQVLDAAIAQGSPLREPVRDFFRSTAKALIVDEIFDGNLVDLRIVAIAAAVGASTTVIGDPWQALYAFRGARPDMVPTLVAQLGFSTYPMGESFRFLTQDMQDLAAALRGGRPVAVPTGGAGDLDVVLASEWATLWSTSIQVLPFSFGRVGNRVDAALAVLLDQVVTSHFGELSTFGPDAAVILGLDPATMRADGTSALVTVLDRLGNGTQAQAEAALSLLRETLVALGSRPIPRLQAANEAIRVDRLQQLAARLKSTKLVPGLTIHQAKGREWDKVGVALTAPEQSRLAAGLSQASATDRALYVALTRAKRRTVSI